MQNRFQKNWRKDVRPCAIVFRNLDKNIKLHDGGVTELVCGKRYVNQDQNFNAGQDYKDRIGTNSKVVFLGNSYINMWSCALGFIGIRRGISFRLFHLAGCPLVGPGAVKYLEPRCRNGIRFMLKKISLLSNGTFIGLSFPLFENEIYTEWYENLSLIHI